LAQICIVIFTFCSLGTANNCEIEKRGVGFAHLRKQIKFDSLRWF
jgi:hypothetical protein